MRELHPLAYTKKGKKSCICYTWMEQINSDVKTYQRSKAKRENKSEVQKEAKKQEKIHLENSFSICNLHFNRYTSSNFLLASTQPPFYVQSSLDAFFRANSSAWRQKWTFKCWKCVFCSCFMRWIWMHFDR